MSMTAPHVDGFLLCRTALHLPERGLIKSIEQGTAGGERYRGGGGEEETRGSKWGSFQKAMGNASALPFNR